MISIGSRPFSEAVGGLQPASAAERRVAPITKTAPTSRLEEQTSSTSQTRETQTLGTLAVQPVPDGGPSIAERSHAETERAIGPLDTTGAGHGSGGMPKTTDQAREPVPPLKQLIDLPTETTAEVQRLREAAASHAEEAALAATEVGASVDTVRQIQTADAPTVDIHR